MKIDTEYLVYTDAKGRDPDSHSPTLKGYNQILWSKKLPCGSVFELQTGKPNTYLYHRSKLGEFFLSSDTITHTYSRWKRLSHITEKVSSEEIKRFRDLCSTVSSHLIYPSNNVNGKRNINAARGMIDKINDRFDLTLECIIRYYLNEDSPLKETFIRYSDFFSLFKNFKGYIDFFLLQDLVSENYNMVNFYLPFDNFKRSSIPLNLEEYISYKKKILNFVAARSKRINTYSLSL